jgi:hypothetical protein
MDFHNEKMSGGGAGGRKILTSVNLKAKLLTKKQMLKPHLKT